MLSKADVKVKPKFERGQMVFVVSPPALQKSLELEKCTGSNVRARPTYDKSDETKVATTHRYVRFFCSFCFLSTLSIFLKLCLKLVFQLSIRLIFELKKFLFFQNF